MVRNCSFLYITLSKKNKIFWIETITWQTFLVFFFEIKKIVTKTCPRDSESFPLKNYFSYDNKFLVETRNSLMNIPKGPFLYYVRVFWGLFEPPTQLRKDIFKTKSGHTSKEPKHKQQSLVDNKEAQSHKDSNADYSCNSTTTLVRQDPSKI